jgi:hypothetical protein
MSIRFSVAALVLMAVVPSAMRAQSAFANFAGRTDASLLYNYVHATGFALNGISASGAYHYHPNLSAVVDLGGVHVNGVGNSGESLTLLTYLLGARYNIHPRFRVDPFGQLLAGGVHAYGGVYPATGSSSGGADAFALTAGGGADFPLNRHIALRGQLEYLFTTLPNGASNRQNDLRVGAGIVAHFGVH